MSLYVLRLKKYDKRINDLWIKLFFSMHYVLRYAKMYYSFSYIPRMHNLFDEIETILHECVFYLKLVWKTYVWPIRVV